MNICMCFYVCLCVCVFRLTVCVSVTSYCYDSENTTLHSSQKKQKQNKKIIKFLISAYLWVGMVDTVVKHGSGLYAPSAGLLVDHGLDIVDHDLILDLHDVQE